MKKDKFIHVKIEEELKEQFHEKAKENAQNPSQLIRLWIEKYVKGE